MDSDHGDRAARYPHINPRPRTRATPPQTQLVNKPAGIPPRAADKPDAAPEEQPQPRKTGYKNPPVDNQFKLGNPGGPGRPKGSKSQDSLLREELLAKQSVRVGGRNRQVAKRVLIAKLLVNNALEKRDHRQLTVVHAEARRLFPEHTTDPAPTAVFDPASDRDFLRELIAAMSMGEPDDAAGDPLRDFATFVFGAGEDDGGDESWVQDEPDASDEEQSDDDS